MKLTITIEASRCGLYVICQPGLGFVVKRASCMLHSERTGHWRGFRLGPIYARTYRRRTT